MEDSQSMLLMSLMIAWGVITAILIVLLIYRVTLSSKEDDQIFIDAAEQHHYREQQELLAKLTRLAKPIIALAVISGILLITSAGIWACRGLKGF